MSGSLVTERPGQPAMSKVITALWRCAVRAAPHRARGPAPAPRRSVVSVDPAIGPDLAAIRALIDACTDRIGCRYWSCETIRRLLDALAAQAERLARVETEIRAWQQAAEESAPAELACRITGLEADQRHLTDCARRRREERDQARVEASALRERLVEVQEALRLHAIHRFNCPRLRWVGAHLEKGACTCGLDEALAGLAPPGEARRPGEEAGE